VAANIQEDFVAEYYPTVWQILLLYKQFIAKWQEYASDPNFITFWPAIEAAIDSLEKYYNKSDDSPIHIVSMFTSC